MLPTDNVGLVPSFETLLLISLMPATFVFLWTLIFGDFKNFMGSRKAYSEFSAKDPVNCYQNFGIKKR